MPEHHHARPRRKPRFDDDGSVVIGGRLPADQGALIMKALELVMDRAADQPDVTAETSEQAADGEIRFRDAGSRVLPDRIVPTPVADDTEIEDWFVSRNGQLDIDADTCLPRWQAGNRIDWDMAVGGFFLNQVPVAVREPLLQQGVDPVDGQR